VRVLRKIRRSAGGLLTLVLVLQVAPAMGSEVTASVSRDRLVEGETLTLVLQTSDPQQSLDADFGVLGEDFEILDQRSETQMSIVNGRQSAVVRVLVTLEPLRAGELLIPALEFPGARTASIPVTVEPAPEPAPGEAPPVFIELALDPESGPYYVHAQLSLTVRIFYQQNLTEAAINPPAPEPASVRLLDEIPFQAERNGKSYRVLERHYAIFPERSGELLIPPLQLTGRLIERGGDRLWQPSLRGRRVRVKSEALTIAVQPRPADYTGQHWLPARRITVSQQLSDADALRVGEPVTRTVIVDAVGLEEHMIEEPPWPALSGVRIYPDQPQGISRDDGQWVLGHREFRYAVVPEQAGELVLPEIRLDWWDTVADRQRTALLPEHRVAVAPSEALPSAASSAPVLQPVEDGADRLPAPAGPASDRWRLAAGILGVLWLATLFLYIRKPASTLSKQPAGAVLSGQEAELLKSIRKACTGGDAASARAVLRRWLRLHGPKRAHGSTMEFAAALEDEALRDAILDLNASGFSPDGEGAWNGAEFWTAFNRWRLGARGPSRQGIDAAPDLYARVR
jgi:hypothetical protein